ncbi:MAG: hypothetical protein J0L52_10995 [Caulobacterales bacterium]|nr:hypothetical protein [Caulobacterales bacterium]
MARSRCGLAFACMAIVGLTACNSGERTASDAATGAMPADIAGLQSSTSGEPLWRLSLEYGTLAAVNRSPATQTPSAPVEAELWIISDLQGGFDTMQIAVTVDCQARTYATDHITTHAGTTLVEATPAQDTSAYPANPDTPYSAMISHVCDAHPGTPPAPDYADFTFAQSVRRASLT